MSVIEMTVSDERKQGSHSCYKALVIHSWVILCKSPCSNADKATTSPTVLILGNWHDPLNHTIGSSSNVSELSGRGRVGYSLGESIA